MTIDPAPTRRLAGRTAPNGVRFPSHENSGSGMTIAAGLAMVIGSGLSEGLAGICGNRLIRATPSHAAKIVATPTPRHRPLGRRPAGNVTVMITKQPKAPSQLQPCCHACSNTSGDAVPTRSDWAVAGRASKPARIAQPMPTRSQPMMFRGRRMTSRAPTAAYGR
jgi:hypothetical protein